MSELNQFRDFPKTEERVCHDRDIVLCNGFEHTFGFKSATNERAFDSHISEDKLVKGNGNFRWLLDVKSHNHYNESGKDLPEQFESWFHCITISQSVLPL